VIKLSRARLAVIGGNEIGRGPGRYFHAWIPLSMASAGRNVRIVFDHGTWVEVRSCVVMELTSLVATIEVARQCESQTQILFEDVLEWRVKENEI
jgi:hypothetical protein